MKDPATRSKQTAIRPGGIVAACGVIELTSFAALYYAVPILYDQIEADTDWSLLSLTITYSAALVLAALLGPRIGTLIDRRGPRHLVVGGAATGAIALATASAAPTFPIFAAAVVATGIAQAATLYPPILAALTIWLGGRKAWPLTVVSLFGGASSAVLAPLLAPLAVEAGWRPALLVVAVGYAVLTIPLAWWGLSAPWPDRIEAATTIDPLHAELPGQQHTAPNGTPPDRRDPATAPSKGRPTALNAVTTSPRYRAFQTAMTITGFGLYGVTLNLIPLVREQGHSYAFAATVFAMVGVGQLAGRIAFAPLAAYGTARGRAIIQVAAAAAAIAFIGLSSSGPALIIGATLAGAIRGAHTLLGTIGLSERWGAANFGALSGHFNRPISLAIAFSPFIGAALATATDSYATAALIVAASVALGTLAASRAT